ncbi:hypothetical protein D9M70_628170 [compost metagenome]
MVRSDLHDRAAVLLGPCRPGGARAAEGIGMACSGSGDLVTIGRNRDETENMPLPKLQPAMDRDMCEAEILPPNASGCPRFEHRWRNP